jgi:hypothetical protein
LSQNLTHFIYQKIEEVWKETGALPEFIEAMRLALPVREEHLDPARDPVRWALLPGLCCQAARGDPGRTGDIATAWFLFYTAAHIFDSIEDQDQPDPWMEGRGAGQAINIASGLLLSASATLSRFQKSGLFGAAAGEICSHFYRSILKMSAGQHLDLASGHPKLDTWFQIAEAKSGTFFSLACWSGARLATAGEAVLEGFARFGSHLGILLQIHDDLDELRGLQERSAGPHIHEVNRSFPIAYALEVLPEDRRGKLLLSLAKAREDDGAVQEVVNLLDQSGAALFFKVEIERRRQEAQSALRSTKPDASAGDQLLSYLDMLRFD